MTPYISEMSKRSMSQTNSQSTQAEECGVSKLSAVEAQEEARFALNELTSHEYSDEEYMKWEEKLCKKAMKIDKTGKINFTPEAWFNWLVKEGLTNEDILNDLAREYGNWNGKEAVN